MNEALKVHNKTIEVTLRIHMLGTKKELYLNRVTKFNT
jgi:hypothetical protein